MLAVPNIILQQCSDQKQSKQLRCVHMKHSNKNSASHPALIPLATWAPSPNQEPSHAKQEIENNCFLLGWDFENLDIWLWGFELRQWRRILDSTASCSIRYSPPPGGKIKIINPPLPTMSWNNASTFQSKLHDQVVGQINTPRFHQLIIQIAGCMVKKILVLLRGKLRHSHLHEAMKHSQSSKFNPRYWGTEICLRSLIPWMVINFTQGLVDDVFSF